VAEPIKQKGKKKQEVGIEDAFGVSANKHEKYRNFCG
jgi:hypothetical protein